MCERQPTIMYLVSVVYELIFRTKYAHEDQIRSEAIAEGLKG